MFKQNSFISIYCFLNDDHEEYMYRKEDEVLGQVNWGFQDYEAAQGNYPGNNLQQDTTAQIFVFNVKLIFH